MVLALCGWGSSSARRSERPVSCCAAAVRLPDFFFPPHISGLHLFKLQVYIFNFMVGIFIVASPEFERTAHNYFSLDIFWLEEGLVSIYNIMSMSNKEWHEKYVCLRPLVSYQKGWLMAASQRQPLMCLGRSRLFQSSILWPPRLTPAMRYFTGSQQSPQSHPGTEWADAHLAGGGGGGGLYRLTWECKNSVLEGVDRNTRDEIERKTF